MKTLHKMMLALLLAAGCSAAPDEGDPSCTGDKCDDVNDVQKSVCDSKFVDMSGRSSKVKPAALGDPIAKAIFKAGTGCPLSYKDIQAKLRETDKTGCEMGGNAGLSTRLVSERSQTRGVPDSYRGVVTRRCGNRPEHAVLFSLFGLTPNGDLPDNVEVIAFDDTKGVFNYYAVEDGAWNFHGDSSDLHKGPGDDGKRRCANCHPGGGLVMKELESPWMHWEGDTTTPGAADFITKHAADLGSKRDGINMESIVRAGNDAVMNKRIDDAKKAGVKELLRPLFCNVEINLHNGAGSTSPVNNDSGSDLSRVPADFLTDSDGLGTFDSVPVDGADYRAQVVANGQKMAARGTMLKDKDGKPALDTIFDFAFAKRSAYDADYVQKLIQAGIIDAEFARDVLSIDFTRPIFSSDRCGLLDFAPTGLADADLTAAKIKDGFLAKLGSPAAGTPAAVLKANLSSANDEQKVQQQVAAFFTACKARPKKDFLADAMKINSLRRNQARELTVLEFDETLPFDTLSVDAKSRLDPKTCTITTQFVAP